jgi:hypothetical protein
MKVNNYEVSLEHEGEVTIHTTPKQLEATSGKVYLTVIELRRLLELAQSKPPANGGKYQEQYFCHAACKGIRMHDVYDDRTIKCNSCGNKRKMA